MNMTKSAVLCVAMSTMLLSCATTGPTGPAWNPTIDQRNVDQAQYQTDLTECRSYASENPEADPDTAMRDGAMRQGAVMGAMTVGAAVLTGGLTLLPMVGGILATNLGLGAAMGGAGARDQANIRYRGIVSACLQGRGYSVIG